MTIPLFHRSVPLTAAILLTSAALASGCKSNSESGGAAGGTSGSSSTQSSSGRSGGSISSSSPGGDHSGGGNSSSSSKPDGSGGSSGTGGATGSCSSEADCGGDVFGTWEVTSSCLTVSGQLDLSGFLGTDCPSPQVTGSLEVTGTWSAKADNTFTDKTTTTGNEQFTLAARLFELLGDHARLRPGLFPPARHGLRLGQLSKGGRRRVQLLGQGRATRRPRGAVHGSFNQRQIHHRGEQDHRRRCQHLRILRFCRQDDLEPANPKSGRDGNG